MRSAVSARPLAGLLAFCLATTIASLSIAGAASATPASGRLASDRSTPRVQPAADGRVRASVAPTVTSLSVATLNQDEATTATIHGSSFASSAGASLGRGVSVAVKSVTPTAITVQLVVARDATLGWRTLTVTNSKSEKGTLSHASHIDSAPIFTRWAIGAGAVNWATSLVRPTFTSTPTLAFSGAGVSVASKSLTAGGRLDVGFTIAPGASATWRTMTLIEGSTSWTVPNGLKVRLAPVVSNVAPLGQGATNQTVRVTGSNFEICKSKEPIVAVSGTGVSVDSVSSALGDKMYVKLSVASNAVLGPRNVTVTNCDSGGVATSNGVFHVVGPPTVTSIAPIAIGVQRNEIVFGTNLTPGTTFTPSGTGVTFSHFAWLSSAKIRVAISVAKSATLGPRDVTAADAGGGNTLDTGVLTVDGLPTEASVSPMGIGANTAIVVTVTGTGLQKGAVVTIRSAGTHDAAILLSPTVVDSPTKLRVVVAATAATTLAQPTLTVTNPDGGAVSTLFTTDPGPTLHAASSTTTQGALVASYTKPPGAPSNEIYDLKACTNAAMSTKCAYATAFKSGRTLGGLVPGVKYYLRLTALASGGYFTSRSFVVGPYLASVRLHAPVITKTASTSTTIKITFKGSSNGPASQAYTARACLNAAMTQGCLSRSHYRSGVAITGVKKATYFVQIFAVASAGYLTAFSKIAIA